MCYNEFMEIPNTLARETIIMQTIDQINSGITQPHSMQSIIAESRQLGLACRMLGKGMTIINGKSYTGKEIADVFVNSVITNGSIYYPVTGVWTKTPVKCITLFVKDDTKTYQPYAKFHIADVIKTSTPPANFNSLCVIPDFLTGFTYQSLLLLDDVQTTNLPTNYLGVTSGVCVRKRAFKGGAANILVI